jgi:hypothetical protein
MKAEVARYGEAETEWRLEFVDDFTSQLGQFSSTI